MLTPPEAQQARGVHAGDTLPHLDAHHFILQVHYWSVLSV